MAWGLGWGPPGLVEPCENGSRATMFVLRCKGLDWVGVKHFLMSLEGARTAMSPLRAVKGNHLWSPWLIRTGRALSPGMLKLMTLSPCHTSTCVPTTKPTVMLVSPHSLETSCVPGCHSEGPRLGGIQQTGHPGASYPQG